MTTFDFLVPDLGEGLAEVEIVSWLVPLRSPVVADAAMVVVQTDKADVEVPSPVDGILVAVGGNEGDVLRTGALLARIETAATAAAAAPPSGPRPRRPLASPATRRRALEAGIDLTTVTGTGPNGRITSDDLDRHAATPAPTPTPGERVGAGRSDGQDEEIPLRGVRRATAHAMAEAWRRIPHIAEFRTIDATELQRVRTLLDARMREEHGTRLTIASLVMCAVARTLRRHPNVNATFDDVREVVTRHARRNIGVATATDSGLIVPVVRRADELGIVELALEIERLASAARSARLAPEELRGGTFTITNFGSNGTHAGVPIIRPPEVAILGVGRIVESVVARGGEPVVAPTMTVTLSLDHRVNDGAHGAAFLNDLARVLAEPALLLMEV